MPGSPQKQPDSNSKWIGKFEALHQFNSNDEPLPTEVTLSQSNARIPHLRQQSNELAVNLGAAHAAHSTIVDEFNQFKERLSEMRSDFNGNNQT